MPTLAVDFRSVVAFADRYPVLAGVDMQVEQGSCVLLTGPNGAGKTSLLRAVAGLLPISRGSGTVLGMRLDGDLRRVRSEVGFLSHQSFLYGDLTIRENLDFVARAHGREGFDVDQACQRLQLDSRLQNVAVDRLSAGQGRRAALAALVARAPRLWLLDEPQTSLDADTRLLLADVLNDAVSQGHTVIFSSHESARDGLAVSRRIEVVGGAVNALLPQAVAGAS